MEAGNGLAATFAELHTLADSIAQEVEFGSTYYRVPLNIDLVNFRGVNGELTLNTFTGDDSTDNKHFARARSAFRDNRAGKNLDPFLVAFLDSRVHVYGVADLEGIHVFLEKRAFNGLKNLLAHDLRTLPVYKVLKRRGQYHCQNCVLWKGQIMGNATFTGRENWDFSGEIVGLLCRKPVKI